MGRDLRYAIRVLLRSPLFTSVAALSFAIGIGGAASVFAVLNAVVLAQPARSRTPSSSTSAEKHLAEEVYPALFVAALRAGPRRGEGPG